MKPGMVQGMWAMLIPENSFFKALFRSINLKLQATFTWFSLEN
jgi:hypothetical protein